MRRITALALVVTMIALLAGCTPKKYQYIDGDGYDYAILNEKHSKYNDEDLEVAAPQIYADTMDELIAKVKNGEFTDKDRHFSRMQKDEQGRIILPDLDNLMVVTHLDNIEWNVAKFYDAGMYCYAHGHDDRYTISAYFGPKVEIILDYSYYDDWHGWPCISPTSTEEEIRHAQSLNQYGKAQYQLYTDALVFYVIEHHRETTTPGIYETEPHYIQMYAELDDDLFLQINIFQFQERPSIEWLSSFGVKPYGE